MPATRSPAARAAVATSTARAPVVTPVRSSPASTSIITSGRAPPPFTAAPISATPSGESAPTRSLVLAATRRSRSALAPTAHSG